MKCRIQLKSTITPIALLIIGGIIYLFFRENNIYLNYYLRRSIFLDLQKILVLYSLNDNLIFNFIINSLPGGLWSFFLLRLIGIIWKSELNWNYYFYVGASLVLIFMSEFLQLLEVLPGLFDLNDILAYFVFSVLALFLNSKGEKNEEKKYN